MNLQNFQRERNASWTRLENLIVAARGRPERLGADGVQELGQRYRAVVADLARLRQSHPHDPLRPRLETLAVQARQLVYDSEFTPSSPVRFLTTRYWRLVRERPTQLIIAALLLFGSAAFAAIYAFVDPAGAAGLVPAEFRAALEPGPDGTANGLGASGQTAFSAFLITHNIQVSILAFVAGIFFTIGTAYILVTNGLLLGAVAGLLVKSGDGAFFVELVAAHGVLEISAIIVASAAGLRMGWALVDPGLQTRREALAAAARGAVLIIVGTMPWFVVAGIIEAFVSRNGFPAVPMVAIGVVVGGGYWALVWLRGRPEPSPDQTLASTLASR